MIARPVIRPITASQVRGLFGREEDSGLPTLAAGEFFLIDDSGNYLTDENGAFLTGTNA